MNASWRVMYLCPTLVSGEACCCGTPVSMMTPGVSARAVRGDQQSRATHMITVVKRASAMRYVMWIVLAGTMAVEMRGTSTMLD